MTDTNNFFTDVNKSNYSKELANLTAYTYAKSAEIAKKYGISPTTAIRATGFSMATMTIFGAMDDNDSATVIEKWENGGCKYPLNLDLTSSDKADKDKSAEDAKAKAEEERKARIEKYHKKIEEIKNAQVLGIKSKDGTSYSLVKYFSITSEDAGIVKVYDVATKEYYNVGVNDIEIIA